MLNVSNKKFIRIEDEFVKKYLNILVLVIVLKFFKIRRDEKLV